MGNDTPALNTHKASATVLKKNMERRIKREIERRSNWNADRLLTPVYDIQFYSKLPDNVTEVPQLEIVEFELVEKGIIPEQQVITLQEQRKRRRIRALQQNCH
jgi:hypothetical protein